MLNKTYTSNAERTFTYITCEYTCVRGECERGHVRAKALKIQRRVSGNVALVHLEKETAPEKAGT